MACARKMTLPLCLLAVLLPAASCNDALGARLRGYNSTEAQAGDRADILNKSGEGVVDSTPTQNSTMLTNPFGNASLEDASSAAAFDWYCGLGCERCGFQCCCYHCFPGEAEIIVRSDDQRQGVAMPVSQLKVGQQVLAEAADRTLSFETVLGFLHFAPEVRGSFHVAVHESGQLRATAQHLIFVVNAQGQRLDVPMKNVRVGDRLLVAGALSRVLAVYKAESPLDAPGGMFAPLTATGTVIVDGAVASTYAGAEAYRRAPHSAYHALFFPVRALAWASKATGFVARERQPDEIHPAARLFQSMLGPFFLAK